MNRFSTSLLVLAVGLAGPAFAAGTAAPKEAKPKVEIVSRGADGKADVVRVDGQEYKVCKGTQTDGCINPQDAGFDWGGKQIDYWPGQPASELKGKLPAQKPAGKPSKPN